MDRILVIAQDADLRRSVQFALEAEGYAVTVRSSMETGELPRHFDCAVIDHHALAPNRADAIAFLQSFAPAILLANVEMHQLSNWAYRTLLKPMLGPALISAIRDAIATRVAPK